MTKTPFFKDSRKSWEEKGFSLNKRRQAQKQLKPLVKKKSFRNIRRVFNRHLRTNYTPFSFNRSWRITLPRKEQFLQTGTKDVLTVSKAKKAQAVINARFTLNNTHLNLRSFEGENLLKRSAGFLKGVKKSTPFANFLLGETFGQMCKKKGFRYVYFSSEGSSKNKKTLFKGLTSSGLKFVRVSLHTRLPHNGCRPRRARRL